MSQELQPQTLERESRSLYQDAWRRLLRNRMSVASMGILVVVIGAVVTSPWLAPFDPAYGETWIQAQRPGFNHPDVRNEMLFRVGDELPLPPRGTARTLEAGQVDLQVRRQTSEELRLVTLRNGNIRSMKSGARRFQEIELVPEEAGSRYLQLADGRRVDGITLRVGESLPEALRTGEGGQQVIVARLVVPHPDGPLGLQVTCREGEVTGLVANGQTLDEIRVLGGDVIRVQVEGEEITHRHWLGTDLQGRDLYSRILVGGWISLAVGVVATLVSLLIGVLYGSISGYFGGMTDAVLMRIVDVLYAVPYMFLVILLLVAFGRSILMLFVALGCVQWLTMARIVRGQVLSLKEKEFVEAARVSGASHWGIITRHLIPNSLGVIVVYSTLTIPAVILQEAFLAFLGLTVQYRGESIDSWGALVDTGRQALGVGGDHWWLLVFPALALAATLFSLNFLGDGLRDALDPKLKGKQ